MGMSCITKYEGGKKKISLFSRLDISLILNLAACAVVRCRLGQSQRSSGTVTGVRPGSMRHQGPARLERRPLESGVAEPLGALQESSYFLSGPSGVWREGWVEAGV